VPFLLWIWDGKIRIQNAGFRFGGSHPRLVLQIRFSREPNKFQTKNEKKEILNLKSCVALSWCAGGLKFSFVQQRFEFLDKKCLVFIFNFIFVHGKPGSG
jgi:hypothetical protein